MRKSWRSSCQSQGKKNDKNTYLLKLWISPKNEENHQVSLLFLFGEVHGGTWTIMDHHGPNTSTSQALARAHNRRSGAREVSRSPAWLMDIPEGGVVLWPPQVSCGFPVKHRCHQGMSTPDLRYFGTTNSCCRVELGTRDCQFQGSHSWTCQRSKQNMNA